MLLLLAGCSMLTPRCSSTCHRLHDADQCHIERPGRDQDELYDNCVDECAQANQQAGDAGEYDPFTRTEPNQSIELDNRAQVELWAQCIDETACDVILDGYCAPVW
ncbi:MAG: hypothetical protein GY913_05720 [Proteobacteria bacterium]|nr:hypothetical protein [Pseudomonadota bacterium]MCP4916402.1 hypothetical protein [Pseudomonadota bacterium]